MTPERWHQIQEVLNQALAIPTNDRARFVADVCADDVELQSDVDSLLAQVSGASDFLSTKNASATREVIPAPSLVGRQIGPYAVKSRLGIGGMGQVYLAEDTRLHRLVAVKALHQDGPVGVQSRERLLREARAVAALNHQNIAAIYDIIERPDDPAGPPYIVMEYVEGETLSDRLRRGPLPLTDALRIGREIATALGAAHTQGVVHRDLKPANLRLKADGHVKVLDFGLARMLAAGDPDASTRTLERGLDSRAPQGVAGTPGYMSPEQLLGRFPQPPTDIFSLGVVLFQMIAGRRPFVGDDFLSNAVAMMTATAPRLSEIAPDVPAAVDDLVARMLDKEPSQRPTAEAVAAELDRAMHAESIVLPGNGVTSARRRFEVVVAVLVVTVSAIIVIGPLRSQFGFGSSPASPVVLAIMPVDTPVGDTTAEYLGTGVAAVVAGNFGSIPHVSVLSRAATTSYAKDNDRFAALQRALGATNVLQLSWRSGDRTPRLRARIQVPGSAEPIWDRTFEGDALSVQRELIEGMMTTLERQRGRRFTSEERSRLRKLPTTKAGALASYAEGLARLDQGGPVIEEAISSLQQAIALDPQFVYAWAAIGEAWWRKYHDDKDASFATKANEALRQAVALDPDSAPVHYALGDMQYRTGQNAQAEASFRRALEVQPDYDAAQRGLAQVLAGLGRVDEAESVLQQAIRFSKNWNNFFMLGTIDYRAGRYTAAAAAFKGAADANPAVAGPFIMLGNTQYILGDLQQAVGNFEHAVRLGPAPRAYANLALAYYDEGRFEDALQSYQLALKGDPRNPDTHRNIGDVQRRLGRSQEARAEYQRAIALAEELLMVNARDVRMIALIALCEAKLGDRAHASGHAAEATALDPTIPEVWQRSAEVYALLNEPDSALRDLTIAVARGFEPRMARRDDELASIRKLPRFEEILRTPPVNARPTRGVQP
jgi:serine/threonine-protein kinase